MSPRPWKTRASGWRRGSSARTTRRSTTHGADTCWPGAARELPLLQAERMTGWIGVDPEPWLGAGQPGRPEREHLSLGGVDVADADVQMDLLRVGRVRPAWRPVIRCVLEAHAGLSVADIDPVAVDPGDRQAEQLRIEVRQPVRVAAVEHHRGKPADHGAPLRRDHRCQCCQRGTTLAARAWDQARYRNCVSDKMLPSGSANHATMSPPGVVHTPLSSWSMPS